MQTDERLDIKRAVVVPGDICLLLFRRMEPSADLLEGQHSGVESDEVSISQIKLPSHSGIRDRQDHALVIREFDFEIIIDFHNPAA